MFFRDLKPKPGVTIAVTLVHVHLPVKLGHRDAVATFIGPLSQQLAAANLGAVTGFEPRREGQDEISGLDIFLGVTDPSRSSLETIARMLEFLQAPCGSSIRLSDSISDPVMFGVTEGLELSITSEVAKDPGARKALIETCRDAIQNHAVSRGWTRRNDRTLFYFYGENFARMKENLSQALDDDPRFSGVVLRRMA
jgi:hypothetical protein